MALTLLNFAAAIRAIGRARVFVGSTATAGLMAELAATEGDITFSAPEELNTLTAEPTGGVAHEATVTVGNVTVTVPAILGDKDLWAKVSAAGTSSAGWDAPQQTVPTTVAIIPEKELGGGLSYSAGAWTRTAGNGVAGATGAAAAPVNAIWLWRAVPTNPGVAYRMADGGKVVRDITFTGMFDGTRPNGHRIYTRGDPGAVTGMGVFAI